MLEVVSLVCACLGAVVSLVLGKWGEDKPLANWISASLTGFFRMLGMLAMLLRGINV
jgi:hypothetical protein